MSLIRVTSCGLYCQAGDFYIDPWRPSAKQRAVITHAHSDHARLGAGEYLTSESGAPLLRARLGESARVSGVRFGEKITLGGTSVSLHPAGHVLGSAQVRVEHKGEVWVISGDYKTQDDATCEPFEAVRCDTFITESTFGLPIYRWPDPAEVLADVNRWWAANKAAGLTSIVYAYALGKAQRILAGLDPSIGPIFVHGATERFLEAYAAAGVKLPRVERAERENVKKAEGAAMIIAPPSAANSPWERKFESVATAFASGWMRIRGTRRRQNIDRGFVLSDHVDWPALLATIEATGASRVGVTHGYTGPVVRWLRETGREAWAIPTHFEGAPGDDDAESPPAGATAAADRTKGEGSPPLLPRDPAGEQASGEECP